MTWSVQSALIFDIDDEGARGSILIIVLIYQGMNEAWNRTDLCHLSFS